MKKAKKIFIKKAITYAFAGFFAGIFLFAIGLGFANAKKIAFGVRVAGINVGNINLPKAQAKLQEATNDFLAKKVVFEVDGKKYETSFENFGVVIDLEKSVNSAYQIGRNGSFAKNFLRQSEAFLRGDNLLFAVEIDNGRFEEYLKNLKSQEIEVGNAFVYFDDEVGDFKIQFSKAGKIINRDKLKKDLKTRAENLNSEKIDTVFAEVYPEVTDEMAKEVLPQAREFLKNHSVLNLAYNSKALWPVDEKVIGGWVDFKISEDKKNLEIGFSKKEIEEYLIQISQNINRDPVDAVLAYKDNKIQEFSLSKDGGYINIENSVLRIKEALNSGEKKAVLEMDIVRPRISIDQIENIGLTSLLSTGVSDFSGSPKNRIHNIKIGAAKFNGILLKPGEEFSFVGILGEVGEAEGYLPELVIKKDKTVPEYGGGICQVSTTAFRAAMLAGLEIKERYSHSFAVKYYSPQGFDAAIYPPSPDLKFVNDTPSNLLIQAKVKGTKVYFEFYGTDDGRKVVLTGPEEYDKKPDGSMKAKLTREIFDKDGNLIRKTVFRSSYKSPDLFPVQRNPLE